MRLSRRLLDGVVLSLMVILALAVSVVSCSSSSDEANESFYMKPSPIATEALAAGEGIETPGTEELGSTDEVVGQAVLDRVKISPEAVEFGIEGSQQFTAAALDNQGNSLPETRISWETTADAGTISGDGTLIAGTKAGVFPEGVIVTAALNDVSVTAAASVTVTPGAAVVVTIPTIEVAVGSTEQLEFVATDEHGNEVSGLEGKWTLLNENAGTLTETGSMKAAEVAWEYGDAVSVTVDVGGETLTANGTVTIMAGPLDQVVIAPESIELGIGMTQQFVVVGTDRFGNRIVDLNFEWSVEDGGGTIDKKGLFTAGEEPATYEDAVMVTASQGDTGKSTTATVTVEPDRIAFVSNRLDDQYDIYLVNTDGTDIERITETGVTEAGISWSPDGRRLMYGAWSEDGGISVMNDDGTRDMQILQNEGSDCMHAQASWSPDGNRVAFVKYLNTDGDYKDVRTDIYVMDLDGGALTQLTDTPDDTEWMPVWSHDGSKIAYDYTQLGHGADVCTMNPDGTGVDRLTKPLTSSSMSIVDSAPAWSPDGKQIAFASNRSGFLNVYVMRANGFNLQRLTANVQGHDWDPDWSVDGSKIFFIWDRDWGTEGREDIHVVNAGGGSVVQITKDDVSIDSLAVAPRKTGVPVSASSIEIPNISRLPRSLDAEQVIARSRGAIVRIETDHETGSGFIIDSAGLIVTNNHVIVDTQEITVHLDDGTQYAATVRNRDMVRDLAVLEIEAEDLPWLELGNAGNLELGEEVMVVGYPLDSETVNMTGGLVSSLDYDKGRDIKWIKTDSAVNEGNYGGPLLNLRGEVVGVVSSKHVGVAVEGVGYAVSASTLAGYLPQLLSEE